MIAILDHGAGNIRSLVNSLRRLGADALVSDDINELRGATKLILPGVGEAWAAMESLNKNNLTDWLREVQVPVLGICLGMQLLFERSDERKTECLGILNGDVVRFPQSDLKIPHMGWNQVRINEPSPLFAGLRDNEHFYFVHSYYAQKGAETVGVTEYGVTFASAVCKHNFYGVQFHPEKSGEAGLRILHNFVELC